MSRSRLSEAEVLSYGLVRKGQSTVRRFYLKWRSKHGLPFRCDNTNCKLHMTQPKWNEQPLPLIMDHIDGNRLHNRSENLRLLCPNCDAQLPTRGGKNKGRIQNTKANGFEIVHRSGRRGATVFPSGISAKTEVGNVGVKIGEKAELEIERTGQCRLSTSIVRTHRSCIVQSRSVHSDGRKP